MSKKIIYDFDNEEGKSLFDLDFVTEGKGKGIAVDPDMTISSEPKRKKRTTKKKDKEEQTSGESIQETIVINQKDLSMAQTNLPYAETYTETTNLLHNTINEIDSYSASVRNELDMIKASKTLKNKYTYITDLTSTGANLISTKITAIRELNKTITDSHNLDLKRQKDMATIGAIGEQDDSKYIQDLYTAFVSNPNIPQNAFMPNQMDFQSFDPGNVPFTTMGVSVSGVTPQQSTELNPEQLRMRLEKNPNIKMVVVYNSTTGQKWFEGRNVATGEVIPNYPVLDPMFLKDTQVYPNEGVARNINLDQTYPLVVINDNNISIY